MGERSDACPEFEERVLESVFAPAPDAALDAHLASCDRCRRAREGFVRASQALHQALASAEEGLLVRDTGSRAVRRPWRWAALGAVAAVALVAVAVWELTQGPDLPENGSGTEREVRAGEPVAPAAAGTERRPRPDAAPEASAPPAPGVLALEIVKDDGRPAPNARIEARVGDVVLGEAVADAVGRATLPARERPMELRIVTDFAPPERRTVDPTARGPVRIALPAGGVVAGRVLVDEGPPREPVALTLWLKNPITSEDHEVFLREMKFHKRTPPIVVQSTDAQGRFEFRSLPEGWSGLIEVPQQYKLDRRTREARRAVPLDRPDAALELKLRRLPFVTGRIVTEDGRPAAYSWIMARREGVDEALAGTLETDAEGRFLIVFEEGHSGPLRVRISDAENRCQRELRIDDADRRGSLGDLALLALRVVPFVVVDDQGAPIAKAVAASGASASEATGSDGRGAIALGPEATVFHVGAPGRRVIEAAIPAGSVEWIRVTLPRANELEVRVVPPAGVEPAGMSLVLASEQELLVAALPLPDAAHRASGADWVDLLPRAGAFSVTYMVPKSGIVRARGIRPGLPFTTQLKDTLGVVLYEGSWTLGEGEARTLEIPLAAPLRQLEVQVTDEEGRPLEDVYAELRSPEPIPTTQPGDPVRVISRGASIARTDSGGRFRFDGLFAEVVDLSLRLGGFVSWRDRALRIPLDGAPVKVRMQQGHTVQLRIEDQAGRPVRRARVSIEGDRSSSEVEDGLHRCKDLPRALLTLRVVVAGKTYELVHDTTVPEARLVVPVHGAMHVRWDFLPERSKWLHVQLTPTGTDGAALAEYVRQQPGGSREVSIPLVLPGEYRVELRSRPGGGAPAEAVSSPATVRVVPDATAEVVLTR